MSVPNQQAAALLTVQPATPAPPPAAGAAPSAWRPPAKNRRTVAAIVLTALAAVAAILYAWQLPPFGGRVEQTDNAYVRGRTTVIASQVSGYVTGVPAQDFELVEPGRLLVRIEDRIYRAKVEQGRASVAAQVASLENSTQAQRSREAAALAQDAAIDNAKAQLARAEADMRRADALVGDGSISFREQDQARAALQQAQAQLRQAHNAREIAREDIKSVTVGRAGLAAAVEGAHAQLHLAEIDLDHTEIRAPEAGQLSEIGVRNGQFVTAGTQLMFLVPADRWVIGNFKEAQTNHMRVGQPATFRVDALGGASFTGHVESIAPAAGSEFAVLKPDNATGNFVKVAQRIAVRIAIDPNQPLAERLAPGASVVARIDTRERR